MQRASCQRRKEMFHSSSLEKATKDDFATSEKDCQNLTFECR